MSEFSRVSMLIDINQLKNKTVAIVELVVSVAMWLKVG